MNNNKNGQKQNFANPGPTRAAARDAAAGEKKRCDRDSCEEQLAIHRICKTGFASADDANQN